MSDDTILISLQAMAPHLSESEVQDMFNHPAKGNRDFQKTLGLFVEHELARQHKQKKLKLQQEMKPQAQGEGEAKPGENQHQMQTESQYKTDTKNKTDNSESKIQNEIVKSLFFF